jgi:hypothetical protein
VGRPSLSVARTRQSLAYYHTANTDKHQQVRRSDRKVENKAAALGHRHYLADADFEVALVSLDDELAAVVYEALASPTRPLHLGRHAFPGRRLPHKALDVGLGGYKLPQEDWGRLNRSLR